MLRAETPVVVIFGKSWDFHVTRVLKTTLEENLIHDRGHGGLLQGGGEGGHL